MSCEAFDRLVDALKDLPGIGAKSAQRITFYLLSHGQTQASNLSSQLTSALENIRQCQSCRHYCEADLCHICSNQHRDTHCICVVETPADLMAIEQTGHYQGRYYVLHGRLSPIDGIGPEELGLSELVKRAENGQINEVILATNSNLEGDATAHFIATQLALHQIPCTRIASGIPMGGELEYLDGRTVRQAMIARTPIEV